MSETRRPLSKRTRFEVFKRDGFVCVYCGAHPPAIVLHVDHVHPVAEGGTNDVDNLVTACEPCNLGKGAKLLSSAPPSLSDRAADLAEREEQIRGYEEVLRARRYRIDDGVDEIADAFTATFDPEFAVYLSDTSRRSVRKFVELLGVCEVVECLRIARSSRAGSEPDSCFRYFCGVCWRRIKGD